ncbi:hypothetical protein [Streptomyces caeruleatus]|uniref:Uncharacterized protein n=1 Tax=Streptomyces caeruleatus TaxID=661399 RepID=A0A101TGG3_9ACTN|nr:hypothetical protein [Streptomyces caeruleatus]KUN91898.1 hypothetical protein AQJ67_41445 [Streptomyces caeruleatus]
MNTPLDTFLSDQALATARDLAGRGTPAVVVLPDTGTCNWCDCDVLAKGHDSEFCAGCPREAASALHVYSATTGQREWHITICPSHKDDAMRFITAIVASGGLQ